jgi:putative ABC transport system permease protein
MKKPGDIRAVRDEIDDNVQRYGAGLAHSISLLGQPDNVLKSSFRRGNTPLDINGILLKFSLVLCIFMVVPAINLSGLNSGRMEKRLAEMGVRKAFGAPNGALLRQILIENFLLTLIGAFAGLLISWLLVVVFSDILFNTFFGPSDTGIIIGNTPGVTPRMLINLTVFALTFLTALLVNVLSAIIPAYRFTKKNITDSLNDNYTL